MVYYSVKYSIQSEGGIRMDKDENATTLEKQEKNLAVEIETAREEGKSEAWIRQNLDI